MFYVKDLHAFANSIIEIMVGQCEKDAVQDLLKNKNDSPISQRESDIIKVDSLGNLLKTTVIDEYLNSKENLANQDMPPHNTSSYMNKIPLDLIPLNWSKCKETQYILEVIALCFGPNRNLSKTNIDTVDLFEKMQDISIKVFIQSFGQDESVFNYDNFISKKKHDS